MAHSWYYMTVWVVRGGGGQGVLCSTESFRPQAARGSAIRGGLCSRSPARGASGFTRQKKKPRKGLTLAFKCFDWTVTAAPFLSQPIGQN